MSSVLKKLSEDLAASKKEKPAEPAKEKEEPKKDAKEVKAEKPSVDDDGGWSSI